MAEETEDLPKIHSRTYPGNNTPSRAGTQLVMGFNNIIAESAIGVIVSGSENVVGEGAVNVSLLNSSGCIVSGGLRNVTIINSSGVTVTEDNTIVQNGVIVSSPIYTSAFPSNYQSAILNPSQVSGGGTTLMLGLAGSITPSQSGKCLIIISGEIISDTTSVNTNLNIRTGTGATPANGDAVSGTLELLESRRMSSATLRVPFALSVISSLTRGTMYWVDMAAGNNGAGNVQLFNVSISIIEQ